MHRSLPDQIQSVLNADARLIYGRTPSDHVTDLLRDNLHWLRVPQRITYKLCLIAYKAIHNSMPDYITNFCTSAADNRLRSSAKNLLQVPRSSTKFGDCSFSVAGPTAWNSLPDHVKNASSLEAFKSRLKTHLLNILMIASNTLNTCTAPFPSALAELRRFINRLIINYYYY